MSSRLANISANQVQGIKALLAKPTLPGAQDQTAMANRTIALQWMYRLDGRDQRTHPQHHTFSGLAQEFFAAHGDA